MHVAAAVALLPALGWGPATASAESGRLADFSLGLTSRAPDSATGMALRVTFRRADDPNAKPPALRSAVIHGPSGLRFDSSAVDRCTASDDELRLLGTDACPAASRLTVGSFSAITGFGPPLDPFEGDDHVFNGPSQLIEVITVKGSSISPAFDRLTISGATLTAHPPAAPGGPPDGEVAVRSIAFELPVRVGGGRSLITTPPDCPADGSWTTTATFGFADGSTDTVASGTPCTHADAAQRLRLRLSVAPRRVRAGRRVRLRFEVASSDEGCIRGATVLLGPRRARADRRGRAVLAVRLRRPGVRLARATSPGCRPASASLRVLAARGAG